MSSDAQRPASTTAGGSPAADPTGPTGIEPGSIGPRLDRLPTTRIQWSQAIISQGAFWGLLLLIDPLAIRIYPYVWEPINAFSQMQYAILVGFENGAGVLIGQYLLNHLADRFGRKPLMVASCVIAGGFVWPIAFTNDWALLMLFMTLAAVGVGGALGLSAVYTSEIAPPANRNRLMLGGQVVAALIISLIGGLPPIYMLPDHVVAFVLLYAALPFVVLLPLVVFGLPESPRWLEGHGRLDEADRIVTRIEQKTTRLLGRQLPEPGSPYRLHRAQEKVRLSELFQGVYLRRILVLLPFWFVGYAGLDYGMQTFQLVYLGEVGNYDASTTFTIFFWGGLVGTVGGTLAGSVLNERIERKTLILCAGIMTFLGGAGYLFAVGNVAVATVSTMLTSGAVLVWAFNGYNYTAVSFPTRLRASANAWTDGIGHMGAVLGPIIASALYAASTGTNHILWFLWFAVIGGLLPCALLFVYGTRQRNAVLEEISV